MTGKRTQARCGGFGISGYGGGGEAMLLWYGTTGIPIALGVVGVVVSVVGMGDCERLLMLLMVGAAKLGLAVSPTTLVCALRMLIAGLVVMKRAGTSSGMDACMLGAGTVATTGGGIRRSLTMLVGFCGYGGGSLRGITGASSGRMSGPRNPVVS